ncbi:unnamed protein product [Ilex paraguariensis]|uniref:Uncharacterized protein n=1 Tax=Ilex paraguariensis TaxID=185542 RepID=A0ABC8UKJ2_9AQUA
MAGPSYSKYVHPLHVFYTKLTSSTLSPMKLKTRIQTFILSHLCRIARVLTKAKSILIEILNEIRSIRFIQSLIESKRKNKHYFDQRRLHYNWCSSHVIKGYSTSHVYYESKWNTVTSMERDDEGESQLSEYVHWLEEKVHSDSATDEIDRLADMFIASCHEKFRLEKVESYRRFQEMMARSVRGFFNSLSLSLSLSTLSLCFIASWLGLENCT